MRPSEQWAPGTGHQSITGHARSSLTHQEIVHRLQSTRCVSKGKNLITGRNPVYIFQPIDWASLRRRTYIVKSDSNLLIYFQPLVSFFGGGDGFRLGVS